MSGPATSPHLPRFVTPDGVFEADSCEPLKAAVLRGDAQMAALARGHYPGEALPEGRLPGLSTVGWWDLTHDQDWGLPTHRNEGLELCLMDRGHHAFTVDGRTHELGPGHVTLTRPWQPHRLGDPHLRSGKLYWLILDLGARRPQEPWRWPSWLPLADEDRVLLTQMLRHQERPVWRADAALVDAFHRLDALLSARRPGRWTRLGAWCADVMGLLLGTLTAGAPTLDAGLASSERAVGMFLADLLHVPDLLARSWTVPEMAEACHLGPTRFTAICRKLTNQGPAQFLRQLRLGRAQRSLRAEPGRSITAIALETGFGSSQHFATSYRQAFGHSPSDERDTERGRRARAGVDPVERRG